jgi:outer membrane protein TolC
MIKPNPLPLNLRASVIIPAYNAEEVLPRCLRALEHQTVPQDQYEVIVIDDGSADNTLWNDFAHKSAWTVGVQVQLNIFNGGSDKAKLEKARIQRMKVAKQVELAKKGIWLQVRKMLTEVKSLEYDIRSEQKQLNLAREVYKTYEEKYKEGLASITDLLVKQSIELEVLLKYLQVANKHSEKVFELEKILDLGGRS